MNSKNGMGGRRYRVSPTGMIAIAALMVLGIADASAQRGGGARGGGGGRMAQSSISGANHAATRPSSGSANRGNANTGNVNTGNVNRGNVNTGNVNRGNINTGNINTGNVNIGNDVNIDIDGNYGYRPGYIRYPVAAGAVIGAMAVTTAAVIGSYYYHLPTSCTVVVKSGISYHYCGSVYYQKTWSGNDVVYVVVNP